MSTGHPYNIDMLSKLYNEILERDVDECGIQAYKHLLKLKNKKFAMHIIQNSLRASTEYQKLQLENMIPLIDVYMCLRNNANTLEHTFNILKLCEKHFMKKYLQLIKNKLMQQTVRTFVILAELFMLDLRKINELFSDLLQKSS